MDFQKGDYLILNSEKNLDTWPKYGYVSGFISYTNCYELFLTNIRKPIATIPEKDIERAYLEVIERIYKKDLKRMLMYL